MSAWVDGKLSLKCSIEVLLKALKNVVPQEWASHIQADPKGKLNIYKYHGVEKSKRKRLDPVLDKKGKPVLDSNGNPLMKERTAHILIPGSGNPNFKTPPGRESDNDWGFEQKADGTWETVFAEFNNTKANSFANRCNVEVGKMRIDMIAKLKGMQSSTTKNGTKTIMELVIDEETQKQMLDLGIA